MCWLRQRSPKLLLLCFLGGIDAIGDQPPRRFALGARVGQGNVWPNAKCQRLVLAIEALIHAPLAPTIRQYEQVQPLRICKFELNRFWFRRFYCSRSERHEGISEMPSGHIPSNIPPKLLDA